MKTEEQIHFLYTLLSNYREDALSMDKVVQKQKAEKAKAKKELDKAIEIFKKCGADGWVEKYEKEMDALLW